jgi:hypothetical protein
VIQFLRRSASASWSTWRNPSVLTGARSKHDDVLLVDAGPRGSAQHEGAALVEQSVTDPKRVPGGQPP